jgi:hypothetical protein
MPYIAPQQRKELDGLIDRLAERIVQEAKGSGYDGAFAGLLNYTCTRLALKVVRQQFGEMRYWLIAILTGTFKNLADEFYRRVAIPYENKQMAQSGDVDLFKEYLEDIEKR